MKRVLILIMAATILVSLFAGCGTATEDSGNHTLYYKDSMKSDKAVATFFNSATGESEEVEMERISEDDEACTFSCEGDCSRYNMAYVSCDGEETDRFDKIAFNKCVSGWYRTEDDLLPYTEGETIDYTPSFDEFTIDGYGFDKKIYVWTPDDYDASSNEKYATVYVLDGQGFAFTGQENQELKGCPVVTEQVKAMSSVTGQKAIVVLISSAAARDYEYVPTFGDSADKKRYESTHDSKYEDVYEDAGMDGTQFADFAAHTLAPYIQQHYNVYTDALHTSVTGASLGGLEAFYIAAEYPDVFGTVGALSPSFWEFDDAAWRDYLGTKDFGSDAPFLYLYTGGESDVGPLVTEMYDRLRELNYPEDKLVMHYNEEGLHDSTIWRNVFSEFLNAMVFQRVEPLQQTDQQ